MTIHDLLIDIGLSSKESKIYITLLRHSNQTISYLAEKSEMNRGTTFVILHSLFKKGLVIKTTKNKIMYFSAIDPKGLINYLEHQEQKISAQKEKVMNMMSQLTAIKNPHTAKPKIEFFEGQEGARYALEDTLTSKEKTLRAFLSIADTAKFTGEEFFDTYTTKRIKKGYKLEVIRTHEKDKQAILENRFAKRYVTSKKENRVVRHVPEDLSFPITMYLYDSKICIISSQEENFAMIIESKELAEMQKKLFNLIWEK